MSLLLSQAGEGLDLDAAQRPQPEARVTSDVFLDVRICSGKRQDCQPPFVLLQVSRGSCAAPRLPNLVLICFDAAIYGIFQF